MTDDTTMASYTASMTAGSGPARAVAELEECAKSIPSMGGHKVGPLLRQLAREAPPEMSIVEVGCWLGAATAQLAMGIRERNDGNTPPIHSFDRWHANEAEVGWAQRKGGAAFQPGQDTLPLVMDSLRPFGANIIFHKGDINDASWDGEPIAIYVDDAAKTPGPFKRMLRTFGPSWIPGTTVIVLMDYNYWATTGVKKHEFQKQFVEAHGEHFNFLQDFGNSGVALRYERAIDFSELA